MEDFETIYKNGSRIYKKAGVNYYSVTSICSVKSPFKGKPGDAAAVGTLTHADISSLYKEAPQPWVKIWKMDFEEVTRRRRACLKMWRDVMGQFDVQDVEFAIFNNEPGIEYAGRVDFSCVDSDGIEAIGDWKTGLSYPYYAAQLAAYAHCLGYDRAYLVFLDSNTERNPEQKAVIQRLNKPELEAGYAEFLDCYRIFKENEVA